MTMQATRQGIDWISLIVAIVFWLATMGHFGWTTPRTDAELICDGIALVIWLYAFRRIT